MPYNFTLATIIPASPQEIYDAWLDSVAHSAMTGSEASMSDAAGDAVSAFDGYISGRNLELVPGERIVQSWRTAEFEEDHPDSLITVTLEDADGGALLTLVHTNVPDELTSDEQGGSEVLFRANEGLFLRAGRQGQDKKGKSEAAREAEGRGQESNKAEAQGDKGRGRQEVEDAARRQEGQSEARYWSQAPRSTPLDGGLGRQS